MEFAVGGVAFKSQCFSKAAFQSAGSILSLITVAMYFGEHWGITSSWDAARFAFSPVARLEGHRSFAQIGNSG